jgi:hypothetical protein
MQFGLDLPLGKLGAASSSAMSQRRSSMNDPGKKRSYAKVSLYATSPAQKSHLLHAFLQLIQPPIDPHLDGALRKSCNFSDHLEGKPLVFDKTLFSSITFTKLGIS